MFFVLFFCFVLSELCLFLTDVTFFCCVFVVVLLFVMQLKEKSEDVAHARAREDELNLQLLVLRSDADEASDGIYCTHSVCLIVFL